MTIKEIFDKGENGTLTYEQFTELAKDAKFADLATGDYVSKKKYEDELASKESQIETLNTTLSNRDKDLKALKGQLETAAQADGADKEALEKLTADMASLQDKYNSDMKAYKKQLEEQSYEFAVKEYANGIEFSSAAAKRDFVNQMRNAGLKMEGGKILGADDYREMYATENADAFIVNDPKPTEPEKPLPKFVEPTGAPEGKKLSLTEMMRMKNENPDINF